MCSERSDICTWILRFNIFFFFFFNDTATTEIYTLSLHDALPISHGDRELVVSVPANQGEWWVLYREPASTAFAVARTTQLTIWLGALLVGAVAVGALFWLSQRLGRLVTGPVLAAVAASRRVPGAD